MPHDQPHPGQRHGRQEMTQHFNPAAYTAHRDHDPVPNREGFEFVLTPQERDRAKLATLQLERRRRELNARDTLQSAVDALVRDLRS